MLLDLMHAWPVDPSRSIMIGDRETDAEAGRRAGLSSYCLRAGETLAGVLDAGLIADIR